LFEDEVIKDKDKSNSNKKEIKQTKSTNQ